MGPQKKGITPEVMTTQEVCDLLRISSKTVERWRKAGKLQGYKVGRRVLFKRDEVLALLDMGMEV